MLGDEGHRGQEKRAALGARPFSGGLFPIPRQGQPASAVIRRMGWGQQGLEKHFAKRSALGTSKGFLVFVKEISVLEQ